MDAKTAPALADEFAGVSRPVGRHHALDLIRGLAAVGIATYHFIKWRYGITVQSLGAFGVYLFFVLSGLTMMFVYGPMFTDRLASGDLREFYWNRVTRIIPLLALVSVAALAWQRPSWERMPVEVAQSLLTGTALFGLQMPAFLSNTAGAWSLGIEAAFYLVFPLVSLWAVSARVRTMLIVVGVLIVAQHLLLLTLREFALATDKHRFFEYYTSPLAFAPFFALGVLIYRLPLQRSVWNLPAALLVASCIGIFSLIDGTNIFASSERYLLLTGMCFLAVWLAYGSITPAWLAGTATFLGNISYSLYLTHWLAFAVARKIAGSSAAAPTKYIIHMAVAVGLAACTFHLFERPIQRRLRGHLRPVAQA